MQIIFDDNQLHLDFAPLTLTRPLAELRFGILTIQESWILILSKFIEKIEVGYITEPYLEPKFKRGDAENGIIIMANIKPTQTLGDEISKLKFGEVLFVNDIQVAKFGAKADKSIRIKLESLLKVDHIWELFQLNDKAIAIDFELLTKGKKSAPLSSTNRTINDSSIFIEEGAKIEFAILNASEGPIYISKGAEIMEGSLIRGPFSMNENSVVKMGSKIYGATSIGPNCKVGGEISNCLFQAYSNKGHDGFLGNSIVGEWCNFGADTNSSNLKNNYSPVKIYSYKTQKEETTNVQFCGVLMGDHSKTGINTMLNTATVVGVSSNIFGAGFPSKYIHSFTWGGVDHIERFILAKAFEVAENMMSRRKMELTEADRTILAYLYRKLA